MLKKYSILIYLSVILLIVGCGNHNKLLKSPDNDLKYEAAIAYFNDKDYYRALQLFDQLSSIYKGTVRGEKINYYTAYCYYEDHDYMLANYYFERFAKNFPTSTNSQEALYMAAYCTYLQSPRYSLDQTPTYEALEQMQAFVNRYPQSDRVEKCNVLMDEMHKKLQKKGFEIANQYLRTQEYEAAVYAYNNLLKEYPDTEYQEESMFNIVLAYYRYAAQSIPEKRKERHQSCIDAYNNFILTYPESDHRNDAEEMNELSILFIKSN